MEKIFRKISCSFKASILQQRFHQAFYSSLMSKTAAACIIGDEILSGKTLDTNSHFLAKSLFNYGIELKRVEIVPDDTDDIINTILRLKSQHDYIFTSGGIGPTHDDITYDAIAKAFQDTLALHESSLKRYKSMSQYEMTPARLRMVTLPTKAKVVYTPNLWVPLCILEGVHILPGVPKLFEAMLNSYLPSLTTSTQFYRQIILTSMVEGDLAERLSQIQEKNKDVKIGSYPTYGTEEEQGTWKVKLSVVGKNKEKTLEVAGLIVVAVNGKLTSLDDTESVNEGKKT
ncbi:hypothetical protein HMI54_004203 [Coelomomyces lativittatus]|nr:hypothetical protein HMI54_004203 [Coelomomyces lativittatus]KAJ1510275.1 hypothetical protein HMI56_006417 [Coelomomyces lativittatus]KAJ1515296.1 hypothetical protein HMI55_003844 [Coelomomyces lativittatus]